MLNLDIKALPIYEGNFGNEGIVFPEGVSFVSPCFKVITVTPTDYYYMATKEQFNPDVETIDDDGTVIAKPKDKGQLLKEADEAYVTAMKEVVMFRDKPFIVQYAYDYQVIVLPKYKNETETKFIWDVTEQDGFEMTKAELTELYDTLADKYEIAYQSRKQARAKALQGEL